MGIIRVMEIQWIKFIKRNVEITDDGVERALSFMDYCKMVVAYHRMTPAQQRAAVRKARAMESE